MAFSFCLVPSRFLLICFATTNTLLLINAFQPSGGGFTTTARFARSTALLFYQDERSLTSSSPGELTLRSEEVRNRWVDKSLDYYSKVMREERRRNLGQVSTEILESEEYHEQFLQLAKIHYFALRKAKDGKPQHAEIIYKKIIQELLDDDDEECDHAKLAVTTLLLALHLQRSGKDPKSTRSVFLRFFRLVNNREEHCACSAKVLVAFALFEMKQGNSLKSLDIALRAVQLDPTLSPVLKWKQFRSSMERRRATQLKSRLTT